MRIAVYAGTFDPITCGHIDIAIRAAKLFDKLIIAIAKENYKENLFSVEERIKFAEESLYGYSNIIVDSFDGLLVDYCVGENASSIIRGLRVVSDFEMEFQMALMNKKLMPCLETVFLMSDPEYLFISSKLIKRASLLGGNIEGMVPKIVEDALLKKHNL